MKKITRALIFTLVFTLVFSVMQFQFSASAAQSNHLSGVRYNNIVWNDADFASSPFGTAKYFNGFIFENLEKIIDCEGAVAVGGNMIPRSDSFSIASLFNNSTTPNYTTFNTGLIVNGDVIGDLTAFNVAGGHVVVSADSKMGKAISTEIALKAPTTSEESELDKLADYYKVNNPKSFGYQNGRTQIRASSGIININEQQIYGNNTQLENFFNTGKTRLLAQSQTLAQQTPTAGASMVHDWHNITFKCVPNVVNYFTLDLTKGGAGSALEKFGQSDPMNFTLDGTFYYQNYGTGTLVVNILTKEGAKIEMRSGSWGDQNKDLGKAMFNFPNSSTVTFVSKAIHGSVLAPKMDFTATSGGCLYGNVAIKSIKVANNGGFELHNFGFDGFPTDVPGGNPSGSLLGWMRSTEIKDASFLADVISSGDAWDFDQAFANTPLKYFENEDVRKKANEKVAEKTEVATPSGEQLVGIKHIWDNGTYFDKYKIQNADVNYDWASWSHHGISGDTVNKGQYSIRRFAAYVEYSQAQLDGSGGVYLAPKDELGNRSYLFPVNDNAFIFVNGKLAYWGGTDTVDGNNQYGALNRVKFEDKNGIKVTSGVNDVFKKVYPHTDGWCIDLEVNKSAVNIKSLLKAGFNRIDIVTDEYWEGGGMNRMYLFNE